MFRSEPHRLRSGTLRVIRAFPFALGAALMGYGGAAMLLAPPLLAATVGAIAGGYVLGRLMRD